MRPLRVAGAVANGGVVGSSNVLAVIRLRLVGDRYVPSGIVIIRLEGRGRGLLASTELSAVGGRTRFVAVGGGGAAAPRSRAAARSARGATAGMPAAVARRWVVGIYA